MAAQNEIKSSKHAVLFTHLKISKRRITIADNMKIVQGDGASPSMFSQLINIKSPIYIAEGTPITLDMLLS